MKPAVVLLSGGIDSATTLAFAKAEGFHLYALSFDYGQRHAIELYFAKRSAASFAVRSHLTVKLHLGEIWKSALTSDDIEVPKSRTGPRTETESNRCGDASAGAENYPAGSGGIPVTYVPARNTIFLSIALAWAESIGAEDIYIGANSLDYSGYPDCRPEFIAGFEKMANLATKASVTGNAGFKIHAPLIHFRKSEIIKKGVQLGVDFSRTWSCYDPKPLKPGFAAGGSDLNFVPCMQCDSCFLRTKGFKEAGLEDPLAI